MILTDTHAHLYADQFDPDRDAMIRRAIDAGVSRMFLPNIDSDSIAGMLKLCAQYPDNCFPMMGLHPCSVDARYEQELSVVEHWLSKKTFAAIGEVGIDLYWDKTFADQQKDALARQIQLALKYDLPVILHTRNAFDECFEIVKEHHSPALKGIFHCFSGTVAEAEKVASLGTFKLGIGGVLTFKNGGLEPVIREIPLEYFVLETDAPYLAPVPHRGKRNEASYLLYVAARFAEIRGISVEEAARITTGNSVSVFGR